MSRFPDRATPPATGTLIAITGIAAMAMNIFLPSLPAMARDFGTSYGVMQLSVALFLAVTGASQLVIGTLADRYGRRPVLLVTYAIFVLVSIGCALSTDVVVFLVFRAAQAVVYSGVILGRTVVRDVLPEDRAASMIGYLTMGMAVVPMLSPALGGYLEATLGWRASFWLMALLGVAGLALIWADLGETRRHAYASFREQARDYPQLLKSRRFWAYAVAMTFSASVYFAYLGGASFVGVQIFGLDSVTLGVLFGASSLGYAAGSFLSGRLSATLGVARMVQIGALVTAGAVGLSLGIFLVGLGSAGSFFGCTMLIGVGYGLTLPNAMSGILSGHPNLAGTASGLGGAMMIGTGAGLSALAGAIMVPDTGAERLLILQLACALISLTAAGFVRPWRRRSR